jgi:hypothetical protein
MMFDPTVVNTKILDLTKEKIRATHSLELSNNTQVVQGFVAYSLYAWSKPLITLLTGLAFGVCASMGLVVILEFKAALKAYEKKEQLNG